MPEQSQGATHPARLKVSFARLVRRVAHDHGLPIRLGQFKNGCTFIFVKLHLTGRGEDIMNWQIISYLPVKEMKSSNWESNKPLSGCIMVAEHVAYPQK